MLEFLALALAGSVIAGIWDLKTTEVPDEIPALMISLGLFLHYANFMATGDLTLFFSLAVGTVLLAAGLLLYRLGQWGGADAWILAAIGYLIPFSAGGRLFMLDYLPNFLVVSAVYMLVYVIILGFRNPRLFSLFISETAERKKLVFGVPLAFGVFLLLLASAFSGVPLNTTPLVISFFIVLLSMLFWSYAKVVEQHEFRRRIKASELKAGDVLDRMVWRGLTPEEVAEARNKNEYVTVKEGVRFVPVFPLTLAVTLLWGNLLAAFLFF